MISIADVIRNRLQNMQVNSPQNQGGAFSNAMGQPVTGYVTPRPQRPLRPQPQPQTQTQGGMFSGLLGQPVVGYGNPAQGGMFSRIMGQPVMGAATTQPQAQGGMFSRIMGQPVMGQGSAAMQVPVSEQTLQPTTQPQTMQGSAMAGQFLSGYLNPRTAFDASFYRRGGNPWEFGGGVMWAPNTTQQLTQAFQQGAMTPQAMPQLNDQQMQALAQIMLRAL